MSTVLTARIANAIAIGLLLACALIVYWTLRSFSYSQRQVEHAQQVEVLLGDTESAVASAARARLTYVFDGHEDSFAQYQHALALIDSKLAELGNDIKDEPRQQVLYQQLRQLIKNRIQLWEKSVALRRSGAPAEPGQPDMTRQSVAFADDIVSVSKQMRDEEAGALATNRASAVMHFVFIIVILISSFVTAVLLLFWHHRLLREELDAREVAEERTREAAGLAREAEQKARASENAANASNDAARKLSARLLSLQDEERRRLARDLHDSTGQHLAAAKMLLSSISSGHEGERKYAECMDLIDRSLKEIRTISHVLHPSGLEEAGFSAAARWYADEFAKRSGIRLKIDIPDLPQRLPREVELGLFRVMQEALANIHRHSKSASAEINLQANPGDLILNIRDHGVGISNETLNRYQTFGASGVGLAGMRERIHELGGTFEVVSSAEGTSLRVVVPILKEPMQVGELQAMATAALGDDSRLPGVNS